MYLETENDSMSKEQNNPNKWKKKHWWDIPKKDNRGKRSDYEKYQGIRK